MKKASNVNLIDGAIDRDALSFAQLDDS